MGFYQFKKTQSIKAPIDKVWEFISTPSNLGKITPDYMNFEITSDEKTERIYPGMIISYKVSPLRGFRTTWVTEITQVVEGSYFIDEQRVGPYKIWHHQHKIEEVGEETLMTDIVSYQPPMGFLGSIANSLLIKKQLETIFAYRRTALIELFGE